MKKSVLSAMVAAVCTVCAAGVLEMQNVAHRGMWDEDVPQNTKEAIKRAYDAGVTWVETDFHHTDAGQIVCIHTAKELVKYTNCTKPVRALTPNDLATLNLAKPGSGKTFRIPTLEEVLAVVPSNGVVQAEIKGYSKQYADLFDAAVKKSGLTEKNVVVSDFAYDEIKDFKSRYPKYRVIWLHSMKDGTPFSVKDCIAKCKAASIDVFCPFAGRIAGKMTPADADSFRAEGIELRVFGVNTPELLKTAKKFGATGFTCNYWHEAFEWAKKIEGIKLLK